MSLLLEADRKNPQYPAPPLPQGWRWLRLGDVCQVNPRRAANLQRHDGTLTTFVPMVAVDERQGVIAMSELKPYSQVKKGYTYFEEGDVLFAKITPCMQNGKHAIARGLRDGIGFGSTEFHVFRPTAEIKSEWLHRFLRQPSVLRAATAHFAGAVGQQRVPGDYLASLALPVPPVPEQERVLALLDEQMAVVEQARAAAEQQVAAAEALPAAILRKAFSRSTAHGWPRIRLLDVCRLLPSRSIATNGDIQVTAITTACLTEQGFNPSGVKLARMRANEVPECVVKPGEILVARSNTPDLVGRVAMFAGEPKGAVASDLTIRIWPAERLSPAFLAAYLSFLYLTGYWRGRAGGASGSMKKITRGQLLEQMVPVPSLSEQEAVTRRLREQMAGVHQVHEAVGAQQAAVSGLPATLLRQALAGKL